MDELELIIVPDDDEAGAAQVFVDGLIDGKPYRFLLDSGAARSAVIADDYTTRLAVTESDKSSGVFKAHSADLVVVPSLTLGSINRHDFSMVRAPANPHVTALIGMDLLKDYCCHFRFADNRLLLSGAPPATAVDWLPLLMDARHHPYLDLRFGVRTAQAVWDTGASLTVVDLGFIRQYPALFEPAGQSSGTDSTGAQLQTPMYTMAASTIERYALPPLRVAGVDLSAVNATIEIPMDAILGYNVLRRANWLFDFPRQRWTITDRLDLP